MATTQDADVILRLYELRREAVLRQAREWFARECNPKSPEELKALIPPGSDANRFFRMVTTYWEMAASLLLRGAVDQDLFLDNCGECLLVWRKLSGLAAVLRQERGPQYLAGIEQVASRWEARRGR